MNPFYVTRSWNSELNKCVYKVAERRWFQLARYLVSIGAVSDQAAEYYEEDGYELHKLPKDERIVKSKREAIMNNAFNEGYADGLWSGMLSRFLNDGFIAPRAGFINSWCRKWCGGITRFEMANGRRGYFLTRNGIRKYMSAIKNLSEYRKQAEIRCAKKNGIEFKENTIFSEC